MCMGSQSANACPINLVHNIFFAHIRWNLHSGNENVNFHGSYGQIVVMEVMSMVVK